MTKDLIRYPIIDYDEDGGWNNTGEGGMFFYAVWDSAQAANCSVDVTPALHMADVLLGAHGPLAEDFEDQRRSWREWSDKGDYSKAWEASAVNFDTVFLLGTTGTSYFYDDYFTIKDASDLTDAGKAIIDAISAQLGTEPTFVSYLDT